LSTLLRVETNKKNTIHVSFALCEEHKNYEFTFFKELEDQISAPDVTGPVKIILKAIRIY